MHASLFLDLPLLWSLQFWAMMNLFTRTFSRCILSFDCLCKHSSLELILFPFAFGSLFVMITSHICYEMPMLRLSYGICGIFLWTSYKVFFFLQNFIAELSQENMTTDNFSSDVLLPGNNSFSELFETLRDPRFQILNEEFQLSERLLLVRLSCIRTIFVYFWHETTFAISF